MSTTPPPLNDRDRALVAAIESIEQDRHLPLRQRVWRALATINKVAGPSLIRFIQQRYEVGEAAADIAYETLYEKLFARLLETDLRRLMAQNPWAWLCKVARHAALDHLRRPGQAAAPPNPTDEEAGGDLAAISADDDPDDLVLEVERDARLARYFAWAVSRLPDLNDAQRRLIHRILVEDWSYDDARRAAGVAGPATKVNARHRKTVSRFNERLMALIKNDLAVRGLALPDPGDRATLDHLADHLAELDVPDAPPWVSLDVEEDVWGAGDDEAEPGAEAAGSAAASTALPPPPPMPIEVLIETWSHRASELALAPSGLPDEQAILGEQARAIFRAATGATAPRPGELPELQRRIDAFLAPYPLQYAQALHALGAAALAAGNEPLGFEALATAVVRFRRMGDDARAETSRALLASHARSAAWVELARRLRADDGVVPGRRVVRASESRLFLGLPEATRRAIDAAVLGAVHRYPAGDYLCVKGNPATAVFLLVAGRVAILDVDDRHVEHFVRVRHGGEMVGEMAVYQARWHRTANCLALEDTEALLLPYDAWSRLLTDPAHAPLQARLRETYFRRRVEACVARAFRGRLDAAARAELADHATPAVEVELSAVAAAEHAEQAPRVQARTRLHDAPARAAKGPGRADAAADGERSLLTRPGSPARWAFLVLDGSLRLHFEARGDRGEHDVVRRGDPGEPPVVGLDPGEVDEAGGPDGTWRCSVRVKRDSRGAWVARFERAWLKRFLAERPIGGA